MYIHLNQIKYFYYFRKKIYISNKKSKKEFFCKLITQINTILCPDFQHY